jgi:hypothetical protein
MMGMDIPLFLAVFMFFHQTAAYAQVQLPAFFAARI